MNKPAPENARLCALRCYQILDTPPESEFDDLTALAAQICETPIAYISFIDKKRQWFKSKIGFEQTDFRRSDSICAQTIKHNDLLVVPNAEQDRRFADLPTVAGELRWRFYAGAPLINPQGHRIGTFCVVDFAPRQLSAAQIKSLQTLARSAMNQLELRRTIAEYKAATKATGETVCALNQAVAETADLYNNAPCGYHTLDKNGLFVSINDTELQWLGYTRDQIIGKKKITDLVVKDSIETIETQRLLLYERGWVKDVEVDFVRQDNTIFSALINAVAVKDRDGNFAYNRATLFDITELKRAEAKAQAANQRLQLHVENSPIGILEWDCDFNILQWSPGMERIFRWKAGEIINRKISDQRFIHEGDAQEVQKNIERLLSGRDKRSSITNRNYTKDGETVVCQWFNSALTDADGKPVSFMSLALDVTARIEMEAALRDARDHALESTRFKSAFLANVSHEIRTPLNGVIGMTNLLLDTNLNEQQQDFAETARTSAEALLAIINDILDLSKIEAGKLTFETIDFDLSNQVEDAVSLLAEKAGGKNLELVAEIMQDVPRFLNGDPNRLRQILLNLLSNAIKFTSSGEVVAAIELIEETDADCSLRFSICDTGVGIDTEVQKRLFEPFVQADASTTRRFGGTGLGLTICKQLVEMMHGKIGVISAPGEGSTFWFTARFGKPVVQPKEIYDFEVLRNRRILILDDDSISRAALARVLTEREMFAFATDNVTVALAELERAAHEQTLYDAALIGTQMLSTNPFAFADKARANTNFGSLKLIALTRFNHNAGGFLSNNFDQQISKPVRTSQLLETISNLLTNKFKTFDLATQIESVEANQSDYKGSILLVEDNSVNIKVALSYLKKLGYAADVAVNGREAVDCVRQKNCEKKSYDLILMDCQMPEMDGYEATKAIRRAESFGELARRTTIVAMTANAMEGDRERCFAVGMDGYAAKPIDFKLLSEILPKWCSSFETKSEAASSVVEESTPTDSEAPVDITTLENMADLFRDDPAFLEELIRLFVEDATESVESLQSLASLADLQSLQNVSHKLKGSSGTFGAKQLSDLSNTLNQLCKQKQLEAAQNMVAAVAAEFARVKQFLQSALHKIVQTTVS